MEAVADTKCRPALYRHGGMVEAKKLGSPAAGVYLECLRNHAASAGGHVVDGCGEFMPAPVASLRCAACGCHRSFHRRVIAEGPPRRLALLPPPSTVVAAAPHLLRYGRPLHDEGTPPEDRLPGAGADDGWDETDEESDYDNGRPMSPLPTPPTGYLAPAPLHMLLSLNTGAPASGSAPAAASSRPPAPMPVPAQGTAPGRSLAAAARKRFRTKFSPGQKQRMRELSERLGWRLQRRDEATVADCCREIGVTRGVFKVWMHNNKHNFVGGLHSARRPASSASVSPIPVPAAAVVQPSSHTAATPQPAAASVSAPPHPPVVHADFNINGSAESYFVQPATATAIGGAPQSS